MADIQKEIARFADPKFKDGYLQGIKAAASYAEMWNETFAPLCRGLRFSDMILLKFNILGRKKPRKFRKSY